VPSPAGLARVLATFGPAYLGSHALTVAQAKAWRAILACRTPALGGHVERCEACGAVRHVHHSCRNRHCPQCQTRAKEAWLEERRRELLPVPYFHLVFTLPHALNGLIAIRARMIYETLFAAASATLTAFAADPRHLGGEAAFTLVLHTWKQDLGRHVHVHALVAGGALTPDGQWLAPKKGFLFPVKALSKVFRGKFVATLQARRTAGGLPMLGATEWRRLRAALFAHDWVVYAKQPLGGPEQVLEYLGRYTHRVAISNERIVAVDAREVAFRVRADAGKKRTLRLAGEEFVRRFLLHVLPAGFKRIRHYGLLAPSRKASRLPAARAALGVPPPDPAVVASVADFMHRVARFDVAACPCCRVGRMVRAGSLPASRPQPAIPRGPP
jgi:hypothetical protein